MPDTLTGLDAISVEFFRLRKGAETNSTKAGLITQCVLYLASVPRCRYSTINPSALKVPISTITRSPRFTGLPLLEKAIQ